MRQRLLTVSHRQPAWVEAACAEYQQRLPRHWHFEVVTIRPEPRQKGADPVRVQAVEAERLRAAVPKGATVIALDERGDAWTTRDLAAQLAEWARRGQDIAWLAGGADGLDAALRADADRRVALSALTLPHGLVRVLLIEQLYRAASLLAGHPYHK